MRAPFFELRLALAAIPLLGVLAGGHAIAQSPAASASASASASGAAAASAAPPAAPADPRIAQIRALLRADLDVAIQPSALFDVPLDDEAAVDVERVRLKALLRALDEASAPPPDPPKNPKSASSSAPSASPSASPASSTRVEIAALDAGDWEGRVALDRARLAFYELSPEERGDLLVAHTRRQEAAKPKESAAAVRARAAEAERQKALQAASEARSEAARLVAEEMARIIGVESAIDEVRAGLASDREALLARKDEVLGWQRRVRDAKAAGPAESDATYAAIRTALRASRDALDAALDELEDSASRVPPLGPDPTAEIGAEVPTAELHARRAEVEKLAVTVQANEADLRSQRAAALQEEIATLNRERLGLIPLLSPSLRSATTGFTEAGMDQARSESRHLVLILRYHRQIASEWLSTLRASKGAQGISAWGVASVLVPWMMLAAAFVWFRRRSPGLLAAAHQRFAKQDRSERRTVPSWQTRAIVVVRGLHRPLEWLAFFWLLVALLPAKARSLLEVEILVVIVGWTLGGALVVNAIHSIVAATDAPTTTSSEDVSKLRLRSLQLVGRVVVVFALILVVSARLVGEGTLYSWVISTCWFAALPVFLVLVRWWREIVFVRVERVRRKSGFETWVLANRRGWTSFLAAMAAAVHLFTVGAYKTVRNWLTGFDIARRAHAYLFKRGLDRLAETEHRTGARPLAQEVLDRLAPDVPATTWIESPADDVIKTLEGRLKKEAHGVIAVIGSIGMGKTTLLQRVDAIASHARLAVCRASTTPDDLAKLLALPPLDDPSAPSRPRLVLLDEAHALVRPVAGGLRPFDAALAFARKNSQDVLWVFALDSIVWPFLQRARDARPLFDDVYHLEPWSDESIGDLLTSRCADGGMVPTFEDLLDKLPPGPDEIDKQEALAAKRTGYFRMVWDYARGNPAIALEAWRASLVEEEATSEAPAGAGALVDAPAPLVQTAVSLSSTEAAAETGDAGGAEPAEGAPPAEAAAPAEAAELTEAAAPTSPTEVADVTRPAESPAGSLTGGQRVVRVRPLQAPPATRLETLPDPALFILRAVLQLSRATVAELSVATRISEPQVQNAVSFGVSQGYYAVDGGIVRVTWPWLRSVMLWLERRHLLVNK